MTAIFAPPTRQSIQLSIAFQIAARILKENGSVELGLLLRVLRLDGKDSKFRLVVDEHSYAFAGATDAQMLDLYELVLNLLEQDLGPLKCGHDCDEKGYPWLPWGYAGVPWRPRPNRKKMTPAQVDELWRRRKHALEIRHPDHSYRRDGKIPMTIWSLAFPETSANDD